MALVGLKNMYYAVLDSDTAETATYQRPKKLASAISVDINPNINEATLYADDMPIATNSAINNISVTIETSDIPLEDQAVLLGSIIQSDTLIARSTDIAPYVGLIFESGTHEGKIRCVKLLKGKFAPSQETINTKGESFNYQVPKLTGSFVARQRDNAWKMIKDYDKGESTADWYTAI